MPRPGAWSKGGKTNAVNVLPVPQAMINLHVVQRSLLMRADAVLLRALELAELAGVELAPVDGALFQVVDAQARDGLPTSVVPYIIRSRVIDMAQASSNLASLDARHETSEPHPSEALRTYWLIFYWLMGLLALTVIVSRINLDRLVPGLNVVIALIIAFAKGALVMLVFMHVQRSSKLTWLFATAAFAWLAMMIALSFNDYLLRETIEPQTKTPPAGERIEAAQR